MNNQRNINLRARQIKGLVRIELPNKKLNLIRGFCEFKLAQVTKIDLNEVEVVLLCLLIMSVPNHTTG